MILSRALYHWPTEPCFIILFPSLRYYIDSSVLSQGNTDIYRELIVKIPDGYFYCMNLEKLDMGNGLRVGELEREWEDKE